MANSIPNITVLNSAVNGRVRYGDTLGIEVGLGTLGGNLFKTYGISGAIQGVNTDLLPLGTVGGINPVPQIRAHSNPAPSGFTPLGVVTSGDGFLASNTVWSADKSALSTNKLELALPLGPSGIPFNSFTT